MTHSQADHVLIDDGIQALQKFDMERFNLTKLNNGHMKEQYTSKCKT
jgi:hypothetical protein